MSLLTKAVQLEKEAEAFGFAWENATQIIDQIQSECQEITEHLGSLESAASERLQEEIGDLFHAVISLCVFCKLDPNKTLNKAVIKFEKRFNAVKTLAGQQGMTGLQDQSFEDLMVLWNEAKKRVG